MIRARVPSHVLSLAVFAAAWFGGARAAPAAPPRPAGKPIPRDVRLTAAPVRPVLRFAHGKTYAVGDGPVSIAAADFDGDGRLDLAAASVIGDTIAILINDGAGGFRPGVTIDTGDYPVGVATGDFNNDHRVD